MMSHRRTIGTDAADREDLVATCPLALSLSEWIAFEPRARAANAADAAFLARRADFISSALSTDASRDGGIAGALAALGWPRFPELNAALRGLPGGCDHAARGPIDWLAAACAADVGGGAAPQEPLLACEWLIRPLVESARREAQEILGEQRLNSDTRYAAAVCEAALRAVPERMANFVLRAYLLERTIECEEQAGVASTVSATRPWCAEDRIRFFALYPALGRLVVTRLRAWAQHAAELALRTARDRDDLLRWLQVADDGVEDVQCGLGDEHAGGRTVSSLKFGGRRVVYKPRPVGTLTFVRDLIGAMTRMDAAHAPEVFTPEVLDRGEYGWVEWIEARPIMDRTAAKRFYRRLGALQGVTWLLGSTDLHSWNAIAAADRPFLLDAETIMAPLHPSIEHGSSALRTLVESPLFTGILPQASGGDGEPDGSAYGDHSDQLTEMELPATNTRRDSFELEWRRQVRSVGTAVPRWLDGTTVDATEYRADFSDGFRSAVEFMLEHRDQLLRPDGVLARSEALLLRVVLRGTADYAQLLMDSYHPHLLRDGALRERHFAVSLGSVLNQRPEISHVLRREVDDLLAGEIPLFYVRAGGRDLLMSSGERSAEFFGESALALVQRRLGELDSQQIVANGWCVDAALGAYQLNRMGEAPAAHCCSRISEVKPPTPRLFLQAARSVAERLLSLAHRVDNELVWFDVSSTHGGSWRVDAGDTSLYRGTSGILLFFHHLADVVPEPAFREAEQRLLDGWLSSLEEQRVPAVGAFTGVAGHLYVALTLLRRYGHRRIFRVVEGALGQLGSGIHRATDNDVIAGTGGVAIVVGRLLDCELGDTIRKAAMAIAVKCADALTAAAEPMEGGYAWRSLDEHPVGMAHGSSGIAFSLRLLARYLPDRRVQLEDLAHGAWLRERAHFVAEVGNWCDPVLLKAVRAGRAPVPWSATWCNGASGIALSRALSLSLGVEGEMREEFRSELEAGLQAALSGIGDGQTLCHGDMGVADLHLTAGVLLEVPAWRDIAYRIGAMVAEDVVARGGQATAGIGYLNDLPGLMSGSAGVGLQMLRLAFPKKVPSVLALQTWSERE